MDTQWRQPLCVHLGNCNSDNKPFAVICFPYDFHCGDIHHNQCFLQRRVLDTFQGKQMLQIKACLIT